MFPTMIKAVFPDRPLYDPLPLLIDFDRVIGQNRHNHFSQSFEITYRLVTCGKKTMYQVTAKIRAIMYLGMSSVYQISVVHLASIVPSETSLRSSSCVMEHVANGFLLHRGWDRVQFQHPLPAVKDDYYQLVCLLQTKHGLFNLTHFPDWSMFPSAENRNNDVQQGNRVF